MKLFYAAPSPFVRKCLVAAHELGLRERIELVPASPHPVNRSAAIIAHNPLGKIPTLIDDDGTVLYDSRVICEYLNAQGDGHLIPAAGPTRGRALVEQSLGDGIMDAAVLAQGFAERIDVGTIAVGCALGYLDLRYASLAWRDQYSAMAVWFARFGARHSMVATRPPPA